MTGLIAGLVMSLALAGCGPAASPQAPPAPPTATQTRAATAVPPPADTPIPAATFAPTDTPLPAPTIAPVPEPATTTATLTLEALLTPPAASGPGETPVIVIPLAGAAAETRAEFSGLAWQGDSLVLLPQYPDRFDDSLLVLPKADILAFLDGRIDGPLTPARLPLKAAGLRDLPGYQGLEAIAFAGDRVFVTVETGTRAAMLGYLLGGQLQAGGAGVFLDVTARASLPPQAPINNFADEALVVMADGTILTLYEANGARVNPAPVAHRFTADLAPLDALPVSNIEYRITDATGADDQGRFWAINYLFPGELDRLDPAPDPLAEQYGRGPTHRVAAAVERLVEFQVLPGSIVLTGRPPIQLRLESVFRSRNWEGIVRLDDRGFLLVTDSFPETILGFVAAPG